MISKNQMQYIIPGKIMKLPHLENVRLGFFLLVCSIILSFAEYKRYDINLNKVILFV